MKTLPIPENFSHRNGVRNLSDQYSYYRKVVVITGASSGIGRSTAIALASRGVHLVLAARDEQTIEEVGQECIAAGGTSLAVCTDVSNSSAVVQLAVKAIATYGHFDVWINNAGVGAIGRFDSIPLEDHEQIIRTDLVGTIAGSHCALKHFRQRGKGTLINVASILAKVPAPLYASYAAAKSGIVGLSDALRQELNNENLTDIHVCTVLPMAHDTPFFERVGNYTGYKAVPISPVYDAKVTVDALVKLVAMPEDQVVTGRQGLLLNVLHRLIPGTVGKFMAGTTRKSQMSQASTAPHTAGYIHSHLGK